LCCFNSSYHCFIFVPWHTNFLCCFNSCYHCFIFVPWLTNFLCCFNSSYHCFIFVPCLTNCYVVSTVVIIASSLFLDIQTFYVNDNHCWNNIKSL
jgi:hypothetical protein